MFAGLRRCFVLSVVLPGCAVAAQAEIAASDTFTLGVIEVIGERDDGATALTTDSVDEEILRTLHREDLSEALDLIPGVAIQNQGQRRERLVTVRGFNSQQVPLFIDGVPVYVPYDGNIDLARFGTGYVSDVIVSKGLSSLLYGPNTLGGAINVVSRRPSAPLEASARIATEFDDDFGNIEQRVVGSIGSLRGNWYGHATASFVNSEGYRLPDGFTTTAAEDGGRRDRADSRDSVISAKIGYVQDADNEYALTYYRQDGRKEDPPYAGTEGVTPRFWAWPYWDKQSLYFVARNGIAGQGTLRWRLFYDTFKNSLESYDDASYTTQTRRYAFAGSHYDDYSYGGNADFEWRWDADNSTRLAAHYKFDVHREAQVQPFSPQERLEIPTYDVAIEHEWRFAPGFSLTPGYAYLMQPARTVQVWDEISAYYDVPVDRADAHNAQLIGTYQLDQQNSFLTGVSRKTRFPTLKDRFSASFGTRVPNPGLKPENALHYEAAYQRRSSSWGLKLALYRSEIDDAIEDVSLEHPSCTDQADCRQLRNVGEQRNQGIELSADYSPIAKLQISGQINLLDRDNRNSPQIKPTNTPERKFLLAADWQFLPQWRLRLDAQHESERYSNSTGTRAAGSFTLANAFLRFEPVRQAGVEIGVRNLTDELYAYEEGYYESGRSWLAQIDYRY